MLTKHIAALMILLLPGTLFADVVMPCFIVENHIHIVDKNKNLVTCKCSLINANTGRHIKPHASWNHKKNDQPTVTPGFGGGNKNYSDTVCYYHHFFNYRLARPCYSKEVPPAIVTEDTIIKALPAPVKKMDMPLTGQPGTGNALWQLYTSSSYLVPLLLTLVIETFIAFFFMLASGIRLRNLWVVPVCSLVTHPVLAYLQWSYPLSFNQLIIAECVIVLAEMLIILAAMHRQVKPVHAFALSAIMNAGSFIAGLAIINMLM